MPRKVLVLTLISLLILSVSVFGAMKSKVTDEIMRKQLEKMENQNYPDESIVTKYVTTPAPKLLGPLPSNVAGFTYYDYQHNDVMRRMIANGTDVDNNIHVTWMDLPSPPIGEERYVDYNSYIDTPPNWLVLDGMHVTPEGARGGYTGLDLLPDQREVLCYHRTQPATPPLFWGTTISIETGGPGSGTFASYDIPDAVQGQPEDLKGEWPTVACAKVTSSPAYIHITHAEGQTSGSVDKAMYYLRCYESGVGQLTCESPGWVAPLVINSNTKLAPNKVCYQYDKCRLGTGVIATSPVSQKVAIVYYRNYASSQTQNELMYIESPNNGQNWIANPAANMVPVQLTNYQAGGGLDRGYDDIAAIYDYNDNLHIVWTTFNSTNSNDVTLWHWTASQGARKAGFAAAASSTKPGAWCLLIAKFTLGIYQPDQTLYLSYTKFRDGDISAGGYANGDICAKGSTNFGLTWGPEVNMTNTNSNGCAAGTCKSEHWSSLAERVDDYLHVDYIADLDPAGFSTPEGAAENDTVIYLKYPRFTIPAIASITYTPTSMIDPMRWAKNNLSTSDSMLFDNVGTSRLYVRLSGPSWLTINPNLFNIVEAGPSQKVNLTLSGAGYSDTILVDSIKIESNDSLVGEVYTNVKWVRIHFVVTDSFYYAEWDTATQLNLKVAVSNIGNIGHQETGWQMNYKGKDYLFDFTPVYVTDQPGYGKMGFTYLHDRKDFIASKRVRVWRDKGACKNLKIFTQMEIHPARFGFPWHWVWWWWTKWDKIWVDYPNSKNPHIRIKNWWWFNPPPRWWPYVFGLPTPNRGGYFGIAGDWDVTSDASGKNLGGYDSTLNLIYQYSDSVGFTKYYGGFQFLKAVVIQGGDTVYKGNAPFGAHVLNNAEQLYPWRGYNDDSLWKYMSMPGWSKGSDSSQDMNIVMSMVPEVIDPDSTTKIEEEYVLLVTDGGLDTLRKYAQILKTTGGGIPGDANIDGKVSVSDVVYLINYLFKGGPEPWVSYSDVNGDEKISVSDVVYLINYLFKGGSRPSDIWCKDTPPWSSDW